MLRDKIALLAPIWASNPTDPSVRFGARYEKRQMMFKGLSQLWQLRKIITILPVALSLPFSSCTSMVKAKDHRAGHWEKFHSNAHLWRRVKDNPAVFYPSKLPPGYAVNAKSGEWVVDVNDGASFFVPHEACDGLSPQMWRTEATKAVDLVKTKQKAKEEAKDFVVNLPQTILTVALILTLFILWLDGEIGADDDDEFP